MYYVYVLQSLKDKQLYIGYTRDLRRRLTEHNEGSTDSLIGRRPLQLIFYEAYLHADEARKREIFYKSGRGHEILYKNLFLTLHQSTGSK